MNKIIVQFLILCALSCFAIEHVSAQQNLATVKVDELSDAQVLQIMKQAESSGATSIGQLEQLALARGMSAQEVQKFKLRAEKLKNQSANSSSATPSTIQGRENSENLPGRERQNETGVADTISYPKIFGADLFRNGNITFEPNLRIATPKGYIVGPDDKLIIDLTGDNEVNYNLTVSTEGAISLPYVGRISVGGLTIDQASSKIKTAMRSTYPALQSGRTTLAINLGNIRSIKVTLTGQVVKSGSYTLSSLSTVYNALYSSGGPSKNGSFRKIQVIRNNKVVATIDVYDFLLKGIQQNNIRLQDQDVINIPVFDKRVELTGEVKQAALFELVGNETLADLISFGGGFTTEAYTARIKSFQNTDRERKITDIQASDFDAYVPKNGDQFVVETILDRFANRVEIMGAVFRPGEFELEKGLTLKGLIQKADGLTENAFLNRGYINRLNPDQTQRLISFDVAKLLAGIEQDIVLLREDKVTINSIFDLRDEYTVTIQGEVRAPGSFQYADNLKLEDVIQLAGGFKEGATPNRIEVSRRVKNSDPNSPLSQTAKLFVLSVDRDLKLATDTFTLQPFDIITVRNSESYVVQKQVKLEGEVLYPGLYTITNKDDRISDLITRAGGLTAAGYAAGASLKRPGAENVNPAAKNVINTKEEQERKFLALQRARESGAKDSLSTDGERQLIESDLVGINLVKILDQPKSKADLFVEDGDIIRIPRQLQTVKITGEVLSPNSIVYSAGRSLRQYINGAGGFTANARRGSVFVKYANGSAASVGKFLIFNNYPKIRPGAEILIPKRAERERISPQAWIGIGTAIASLGAIIVSLLR